MLQMSIFDDDDKRMTEIDDRCKDYRRLGSFFEPWYWQIQQEEYKYTILSHIDIDPLENIYDNIAYIKGAVATKLINEKNSFSFK